MLATGLHSAHFERQGKSGAAKAARYEGDEKEREVLHMTNDRPWGITQGGRLKEGHEAAGVQRWPLGHREHS